MKRFKQRKNIITLLNSDENILKILQKSNEYLEINKELAEKIKENVWISRSLIDLVPETIEKFWSGHIFPLTEMEYELESSIQFCKMGFYKHAITTLRNVLELGMLSVYWDIEGKSHIDIKNWFGSFESTPFKGDVFKKLKTKFNIKKFDDKHKIFNEISILYEQLCNFAHKKGFYFSSRKLENSNINTFNEKSLNKWVNFMADVIKTIVVLHILKYPVALQYTPIDDKFGIDGPLGGFLTPFQTERIKKLFSNDVLITLQKISDDDPEAKNMGAWVNERSDITEQEFLEQIEAHDKQMIEMSGFQHWIKNEKKIYKNLKEKKSEEYTEKLLYFKKIQKWAKENDLITQDRFKNIKI